MPIKPEESQWMENLHDDSQMHGSDTNDGSIKEPATPRTAAKRISNCMTPMACQTCGRVYSNASNLRQHIRLIHNPAPVICTICQKHYSSVLYLKRHYNAVHGSGGGHHTTSSSKERDEWKLFEQAKSN